MAQTSWPFDNIDTSETQFSQWSRNIGEGVKGNTATTDLQVFGDSSGLQVKVPAGQALVRGHYYYSTATETLAIATADPTNPRIDSIVLNLDPVANAITLLVVKGTAAASPVAPSLTQTDAGVYQLLLANVAVGAAVGVITAGNVTDLRTFLQKGLGIWSTTTRPASPVTGQTVGYNVTLGYHEYWNGSAWTQLGLSIANIASSFLTDVAGKNKVINGGFDFWQRGTSFTLTSGQAFFAADRWTAYANGGSATYSQQAFTPGTAPVAGYESAYFLREVAGTGAQIYLEQKVEDVRTFAGQTVTLSFWARAGAAFSLQVGLTQGYGSGGSSWVTFATPSFSLSTSWARYSYTVTVPSLSGKTLGTGSVLDLIFSSSTTGQTLDIWGVQLEAGSVATPFSRAGGDYASEDRLCKRYYQRLIAEGGYGPFGTGQGIIATASQQIVQFPVQMRTAPTSLDWSGTAAAYTIDDGVSSYACSGASAITLAGSAWTNTRSALLILTHASGVTQYRPYRFWGNNTAGAYIGFSAEL